jgi:RNA polymerase sigma-70 factor (ECF subfamily)
MKISRQNFEQLALAQVDTLYRVARRLTRDEATAEDLVQETYLRAFRAAENFELQEYGIKPWLLRIMQNLYVSRGEREQRQPQSMEDGQLEIGEPQSAAALPIDAVSFDAMDEQLVAALKDLPAEYQQAMLLWAVDELSYKEMAVVLDVPIGTVMSRLFRARQKLATSLRDYAQREGLIRE